MPKQLQQEALKVIENILGNTLESEEFVLIRIGTRYQEKYKPIFTSPFGMWGVDVYYYELPNLPKFLIEEKLPISWIKGHYDYRDVEELNHLKELALRHEILQPQVISTSTPNLDPLSVALLEYNVINNDISNAYTFLFKRGQLLNYFNYYSNTAPMIDYENKQFLFLGESFPMKGAIEQAIIEELIQNINSVVSMEKLKEVRVQIDKEYTRRDDPNFQSIEENIKDTVNNFIKKVNKNKLTKGVLFSRQNSGFGLFIDQSCLKNNLLQ